LIEEVALRDLDVADVLAQSRDMRVGLPPDEAPYFVPVREQMLGEVGPVLPGDAGDERSPGQRNLRDLFPIFPPSGTNPLDGCK
jgi:hypothetical protein